MCESDMVTLRRAEAQVQYRNCAESALTIHVYFTHCASARGRALRKNKVRLGIHLRREWDCTVVSVRPEVTERWMDRFVVDLVECPSVSRTSTVARTFEPAVSEEYSPVVFSGRGRGGGGGAVADAYPLLVVEPDPAVVSGLHAVVSDCQLPVLNFRPFFWGRSPLMRLAWALARRVSEWIRRKLCRSEQTSEPCWLVLPRVQPRR